VEDNNIGPDIVCGRNPIEDENLKFIQGGKKYQRNKENYVCL
jgi:hypothetical protein